MSWDTGRKQPSFLFAQNWPEQSFWARRPNVAICLRPQGSQFLPHWRLVGKLGYLARSVW